MGRHGPERARYDGQTWRRLGRRLLRIAGCHETADICPARTPLFYTQHGWVVTTLLCVKTYLCIHAPFPFRPRITRFPPQLQLPPFLPLACELFALDLHLGRERVGDSVAEVR